MNVNCGDCPPEPHNSDCRPPCPPPCPPIDISVQPLELSNGCPDRVNLPSLVRPRNLKDWLASIVDQFCTLNPLGIRAAKACQVMMTAADPRGGSMVVPRDILDALNCAPFTAPGQGFVFDGVKVQVAPIEGSIDKLIELKDGPQSIVPDAFLVGTGIDSWNWKAGCLPPCPTKPGLTLQSTSGGGMQWGPAQTPGIQCKELKMKIVTCLPKKTEFPDRLFGVSATNGDICDLTAGSFSTCDIIRTGLKTCLTTKTGNPTSILGFDADGNPWRYEQGTGLSCATLKTTAPIALPVDRPAEVFGVRSGTDAACARFVRDCDVNFRASCGPSGIASANKLILGWAVEPIYAAMSEDINLGGVCAGVFEKNNVAGDLSGYRVKSKGRYSIEASQWVNILFNASGPGKITPDAIFAVLGSIAIFTTSGNTEFRIGEISQSIDYVTDPTGAYTVNNTTKGLSSNGLNFFFSRTMTLDLNPGDLISVPRVRVTNVYNASDLGVTITLRQDGESVLSVSKLANHSF